MINEHLLHHLGDLFMARRRQGRAPSGQTFEQFLRAQQHLRSLALVESRTRLRASSACSQQVTA